LIDIEKLKQEIGERLTRARKEKDMSQDEVARMLGLSKVGYGAFERGKNLIGLNYLVMLTHIFGKPITALLPEYVTTEEERNSPFLDPNLRDIVESWPHLPDDAKPLIADIAKTIAAKEKSDETATQL